MKVKICSCGHERESHFKTCFDCEVLKQKPCRKFVYVYDATLGKINSVYIDSNDDHGLKVFYVDMDFSGYHQSMQIVMSKRNKTSAFGTALTKAMKKFFAVKNLDDVKDKYCYALRDANDPRGYIKGILSESILGYEQPNVIITQKIYEKWKD